MPTIQNDFLPFATGPGANVVDQATYAALTALATGFLSGTAQSVQVNKVWRQSSIMAAVIAQFIVAQTGQAAVDDGTTPTLLANFTKAVNAASKQRVILTDTGSVNALAAANAVPMAALPTASGVVQTIAVKVTNTGASTYSPDGLASRPIFGLGGAALQGGEMVANGIATLVSYVGPLLNGGALCWVLFECIGGAQQVAPATQPQHAMQLGQATGRLINIQRFTASGTYTPTPGTTSIIAEGVGAGAGGAGATATSSQTSCGGGGGGGAYAKVRITAVPASASVTVGSGGSAGGTTGGAGGATSFGSYFSVGGGAGGQASAAVAGQSTGAPGGGSTTITIGGGATLIEQGQGGMGDWGLVWGVGTVGLGGKGGISFFGGGANGAGSGNTGFSPSSYGAGGGGACNANTGAGLAGGAGAPGVVIVYEFA
ncbi:hypothetical protein [Burkholderia sp. AU28863]|uniref:glycine-rich domain-containing protein n=1 Tax=Burkholderia sp. AU28863 TaxID=2015352 RepID=UPI00211B2EFC|nr:hypothetical protein [Burkholderia sp. AU28863]